MVIRPRGHGRRLSDLSDEGRLAGKARAVRGGRRPHLPHRLLRKDKLTLPDLGVPVPVIINSGLAKKHATDKDPWAMEWLKNNEAGGGAFRVEKWPPGQEVVYARYDDWKSGRCRNCSA